LQKEGSNEISKTCKKCDSGYFCEDGIVEKKQSTCQNPPSGYVCKNNKLVACSQLFSSNCSACTLQKCTSCGWAQHADSKGNCVGCGITWCASCKNCDGKDSCTICQGCMEGVLINNNTACRKCYQITSNCAYCNASTGVCTSCNNGYFLTNTNQCQQCTLANCMECKAGQAANAQKCNRCKPDYYINGGACATCTSKFGSNCVTCNASRCLACASGYHLTETPTNTNACSSNEGVWKCNDNNFMKVGNLCVTRYNMGDVPLLKIPSSVHTTPAGGEYCYTASGEKCCWSNVGNCNGNGTYKGCRTRCNLPAAVEICKNFNYAGLKWRLPTYNEVKEFILNNYVHDSGLQFCQEGGAVLTKCDRPSTCMGSYTGISNDCWTQDVATQEEDGRCGNCGLGYLNTVSGGYGSVGGCTMDRVPFHVRCVAEMKDDE